MINIFKPSNFPYTDEASAEVANSVLNAYIQCLEKVYGDIRLGSYHGSPLLWSVDEKPDSTHVARIISVERITKPEVACK